MPWLVALLLQVAIESPQEAFARAEAHYQEQHFDDAIAAYEAMRAQSIEDGVLYYNLGNAYFKAGKIGLAVLNYERALELMPGDRETRTNLAFANDLIAGGVEPAPLPLVIRWLVQFYQRVRPDILARVLSLSFVFAGGLLTIFIYDGWPSWRSATIAALVLCGLTALLSGVTLATKLNQAANRVEAIVLTENAYVRSGPGEGSPRLAEVHEGLKVRVIGEREDWFQVTLANGLAGWIRRSEMEKI